MKIRTGVIVIAAAGMLAVTTGPAAAHTRKHGTAHKGAAEAGFVKKAAAGGLAEVEMGKVAQEHAQNDQVKQFAERMVTDHSKANDELTQLAQKKGITVPTDTDKKHKQAADRMAKLSGAAFDRAYIKEQVADHHDAVALFQHEAKSGKDADVKEWAANTLPTLEDHAKSAREIAKQMGAPHHRHARASHAGARHASTHTPSS